MSINNVVKAIETEGKKIWFEDLPWVKFNRHGGKTVRAVTEKNREYLIQDGRPFTVFDLDDLKWFLSKARNGDYSAFISYGQTTSVAWPVIKDKVAECLYFLRHNLAKIQKNGGWVDPDASAPAKEVIYIPLPHVQFKGDRPSHRGSANGHDYVFIGQAPIPVENLEDFQWFAAQSQQKRYKCLIKKGPMTKARIEKIIKEHDKTYLGKILTWAKENGIEEED